MATPSESFIAELTKPHRALLLGGLAVIAHGLERATRDVDIWLDPLTDTRAWCQTVVDILSRFTSAHPYDLRQKRKVNTVEMPLITDRDGVIRIAGLDRPLDIFRTPNNFNASDFTVVWNRSLALGGSENLRLPDEVDLLLTKEDTRRPHDVADISFLQEKVRQRYRLVLPMCDPKDGRTILDRYADHVLLHAAMQNPHSELREYAAQLLKELNPKGDPFEGPS